MVGLLRSLQAVPRDHAFAQLSSSDNIIAFTTARYSKQPLVIRCALQAVQEQRLQTMHRHCRKCAVAVFIDWCHPITQLSWK